MCLVKVSFSGTIWTEEFDQLYRRSTESKINHLYVTLIYFSQFIVFFVFFFLFFFLFFFF